MPERGRILIADDVVSFLNSTADNLRKEGYECDCARDSAAAERLIRERDYDVLIADIRMPGNENLEFISALPKLAKGLPVIIVTAYSDVKSAKFSVQLPVAAYLSKPFNFEELLKHVQLLTSRSRVLAAVRGTADHCRSWLKELTDIETLMNDERNDALSVSPEAFLAVTLHNIAVSLQNLKSLVDAFANASAERDVCRLLNCPKEARLMEAIENTLKVLERSKRHFKSRELGELRSRLEVLIEKKSN